MHDPLQQPLEGERAVPYTAVNRRIIRSDLKTYLQDLMIQNTNQYLCE